MERLAMIRCLSGFLSLSGFGGLFWSSSRREILAWTAAGFVVFGLSPPGLANGSPYPKTDIRSGGPAMILVLGAEGESEFGADFDRQADQWRQLALHAGLSLHSVGRAATNSVVDRVQFQQLLELAPATDLNPLWLVMIGHGTYDGNEARFNLRGPDVSATELAVWLQPIRRPLLLINTASSSAPFLNRLSASNRIVITATRDGYEQNYTRFGTYLAQAFGQLGSDLDQDGRISLLEAFLSAADQVKEFYESAGRLATEHALIDDNGDGLGTPADWFRGVRATKSAAKGASVDGWRAHQIHLLPGGEDLQLTPEQRRQRDALELAIVQWREKKPELSETEYYSHLESLLLNLARLLEDRAATQERP